MTDELAEQVRQQLNSGDIIALLFACGDGKRWNREFPKEAAPISGIPLVQRTALQVRAVGAQCVLITHKAELQGLGEVWYTPEAYRWLPETIFHTSWMWRAQTVALLGDVVFSDAAIANIMAYRGPMMYWGDRPEHEFFAMSFMFAEAPVLQRAISALIVSGILGSGSGLHALKNSLERLGAQVPIRHIDDGTIDLDTWGKYEKALAMFEAET